MNLFTKARLLTHIARWRLTWDKRDTHYRPRNVSNPKFKSAIEAAAMIPDSAVVIGAGMGANQRASILYWAIKERWLREKAPKNLTWISVGAHGGRGRVPGTMEELAYDGLITRYIMGHVETQKGFLKLADAGKLELHIMAQGEMCFLLEAQGKGEDSLLSKTGLNSFCDPSFGRGTAVSKNAKDNFITREGEFLRYRLPKVNVAVFIVPYADNEGNLYVKNAAMFTEAYDAAMAVKKNGGLVLVAVGDVIPKDPKAIFLPADKVDAIVVNPRNEQTGSVPQRRYWKMFTEGAQVDVVEAVKELKFINNTLKITPVRKETENAVARLAASRVVREIKRGSLINIGVGLPEEVCRLFFETGLYKDITFVTETGNVGGLPSPGIFFGAAINPREIVSSAAVFHRCMESLDVTILGQLQVDSQGNVNVSQRGEGCKNYVGPGGFPTLVYAAKTIFIVGSWQAGAKMELIDGRLNILKQGSPKFVDKVDEVTMSGAEALKAGKRVFYITNVGVFRLTERGMELCEVMPGVDIERDILKSTPMKVVLPENGQVPVVPRPIVTGEGFNLSWE